jgi:hypothetical protein
VSPSPSLPRCLPHRLSHCASLTVSPTVPPSLSLPLCLPHRLSHCASLTVSPTAPPSPSLPLCLPHRLSHCASLTVSPTVTPSPSLPLCLPHRLDAGVGVRSDAAHVQRQGRARLHPQPGMISPDITPLQHICSSRLRTRQMPAPSSSHRSIICH